MTTATKAYTIRNDFHNSAATVRCGEDGMLSPSQIRRIRRALCGIHDCKCGGALSERGPQECEIEVHDADTIAIRQKAGEVEDMGVWKATGGPVTGGSMSGGIPVYFYNEVQDKTCRRTGYWMSGAQLVIRGDGILVDNDTHEDIKGAGRVPESQF